VNLASQSQIAVIDRNTREIKKWKLVGAGTNFAMALDEKDRRLFVSARRPASLLVLDMDTGRQVAKLPGAADSDDMWYDATRKRIYIPGGEGLISFTSKSMPIAIFCWRKCRVRSGPVRVHIMVRSGNTIASTSQCQIGRTKVPSSGYMKPAIESAPATLSCRLSQLF